MAELTDYQRDILVRTALGEARGQGPDGMADVVQVILNRARSGDFPSDPAEVALQNKQFSTWNTGAGGNNPQQFSTSSKAYQDAADIVDLVASGRAPDMTGGALDYHASNITPYWADSKKSQYGTIERNGHTFYPNHPVPPGEVPSVASLLSVYRAPPTPVTPSIDMAQMRRSTAPSRLVEDSFTSLPRGNPNRLGDGLGMSPIQGGKQTAPGFDAIYDTRTGQMRMLPQTEEVSSQGIGLGISRAPAPVPALPSPQLAGRRATDPTLQAALDARYAAPIPAVQSVDLRQSRLPLPSPSPIGQPPSTRSVASVPMPPIRKAIPQTFAGMDGGAPRFPDRLLPSPANPPANFGGIDPIQPLPGVGVATAATNPIGALSLPPALPSRPMSVAERNRVTPMAPYRAVADQIDVVPPRVAPVPFPRPNFGMGGVDINAPLTRNGVAAPTPMPRLQRGGMFGNPQIMGHDVPLPGILGVLQGATKAMNNSSGPFNNGADNSIYNLMRGGDFNTPGAATATSGGYLFAPRQGGGWLNVGRANPNLSPQQTYDAANLGLFNNGGNGTGSGSGGGLNTVFDRAFSEARNHN